VKYSVPSIISGVLSFLYSAGALKLSDFQRQATARFATLAGVMASSGEYRVPRDHDGSDATLRRLASQEKAGGLCGGQGSGRGQQEQGSSKTSMHQPPPPCGDRLF